MQFEWDPAKSAANLVKHGIAFEDAQALWDGLVLPMDTKAGNDDHRDLAVGIINHKHWVAVTTPRGEKTRIISTRRLTAVRTCASTSTSPKER